MTTLKLLNYFRCRECLSTFTSYENKIDVCVCDGDVEKLGKVRQDNSVFTEKDKCACDARCTNAQGPNCDCVCGGVNHGTGKMITVIIELGKAKVKEIDQKAIDKANEFRKAKQEALDRFEKQFKEYEEKQKRGEWLDRNIWYKMYSFKKEYRKACDMKVHNRRIETLNSLLNEGYVDL